MGCLKGGGIIAQLAEVVVNIAVPLLQQGRARSAAHRDSPRQPASSTERDSTICNP